MRQYRSTLPIPPRSQVRSPLSRPTVACAATSALADFGERPPFRWSQTARETERVYPEVLARNLRDRQTSAPVTSGDTRADAQRGHSRNVVATRLGQTKAGREARFRACAALLSVA